MKTTKILLILICTFIVSISFATEPAVAVKKVINAEITYPEFARKALLEGVVYVTFTIDETGKIKVKESNSLCEQLREYVIEKLNNLSVTPDSEYKGITYSMKFSFKLTE
jgi:hypothetical protein